MSSTRSGYFYAFAAYGCWGFFPIYWKLLAQVPPLEILGHRVIWAFVFYTLILLYRHKHFKFYWPRDPRTWITLTAGAVFLMTNWFVYIYAVNSHRIVESSLGYFINPLVNIMLGVLVLHETLNRWQKLATLAALIGVVIISQGGIPWLALVLAITFSLYGLVKKTMAVPAVESNQFESFILLPLIALFFIYMPELIGRPLADWNPRENIGTLLLLVGGGIITGVPLIFFAEAARRLPLYMMGFFQFISPSLQFLTGVIIFNEVLTLQKLIGFLFIWLAGVLVLLNHWFIVKSLRSSSQASVIVDDSKTT